MPDNYNEDLFAYDYNRLKKMMSIIKYRMEKYDTEPHPIATCNFDGVGNCVQLVTAYKHKYNLSNKFIVPNREYTSIRSVDTEYSIWGAVFFAR